jgi:methyl-accepting chemotaxis protein
VIARRRSPRRPAAAAAGADALAELAAYRAAIAAIGAACDRISEGDLEARVPPLEGPDELARVRSQLNHMIDVADAFVREASASLAAAADGRYHRQFLVHGMSGSFRAGASVINESRASMQAAAARIAEETATRAAVAETVVDVSTHVAAASTELSASAGALTEAATAAVSDAAAAVDAVQSLEKLSEHIEQAVALIGGVAAQTNLLALNAAIEAARAGQFGRGFGVVADEVKSLAAETAEASADIARQVDASRAATAAAVESIRRIADTVSMMDQQVAGIAAAAGQGGSDAAPGLSQMAEALRLELQRLVA